MSITKTTAAGTKVYSFPGVAGSTVPNWFNYRRQNGTTISYGAKPSVHVVNRKVGRDSSITTQNGKQGFNPCFHSQKIWIPQSSPEASRQVDLQPSSSTITATTVVHGESPYSTMHYWSGGYSGFTTEVANLAIPTNVDWAALGSSALQAMLPTLSTSNSLPNFLLELRDMRFVWKALTGKYNSKLSFLKATLGAAWSQKIGQKPMSRLSNGYLAYEFGWRPFASDVIELAASMISLRERVRDAIARANLPQQRYWGTWVPGTQVSEQIVRQRSAIAPSAGGTTGSFIGCDGDTRVVLMATEGIRYHATMRYKYPLPPALQGVTGQLNAALDSLGINANPAIIWNAIPFTFVVDWFVNVGKYLERFRQDNVVFQTMITDFCQSTKYQRRVVYRVRGQHRTTSGSFIGSYVDADYCDVMRYDRRVGIPNLYNAITSSGLSMREFSLGGALVAARR